MQKPLVGSNQKTDIEEVVALLQMLPVGSNQKTESREVPPTPQRPLAGSDQKTETEELAKPKDRDRGFTARSAVAS